MQHLIQLLSQKIMDEPVKSAVDVSSLAIIFGTLANWLPTAAAIVSLAWGVLRCYETWLDIQQKRKGDKHGNDRSRQEVRDWRQEHDGGAGV